MDYGKWCLNESEPWVSSFLVCSSDMCVVGIYSRWHSSRIGESPLLWICMRRNLFVGYESQARNPITNHRHVVQRSWKALFSLFWWGSINPGAAKPVAEDPKERSSVSTLARESWWHIWLVRLSVLYPLITSFAGCLYIYVGNLNTSQSPELSPYSWIGQVFML